MTSFKQFKKRALARPEVRTAYDAAAEEFAFLDEVLKARAAAGLTQAEAPLWQPSCGRPLRIGAEERSSIALFSLATSNDG